MWSGCLIFTKQVHFAYNSNCVDVHHPPMGTFIAMIEIIMHPRRKFQQFQIRFFYLFIYFVIINFFMWKAAIIIHNSHIRNLVENRGFLSPGTLYFRLQGTLLWVCVFGNVRGGYCSKPHMNPDLESCGIIRFLVGKPWYKIWIFHRYTLTGRLLAAFCWLLCSLYAMLLFHFSHHECGMKT